MHIDLLQASFACASIARRLGPFRGYARSAAPNRALFTLEGADRIVGEWGRLPAPLGSRARYEAHYNSLDKAFWFYDAGADAWHTWRGEDAGIATLYAVGEGAWEWDCKE
jgi:hypothetical protein